MINSNVQETMLLLSEALTVANQIDEAIQLYTEVLNARSGGGEPTKDIYRAIAPLYTQKGNYIEAANSLFKVLEFEDQELSKVGILTKIAGNYKKVEDFEKCLDSSKAAYDLIKKL